MLLALGLALFELRMQDQVAVGLHFLLLSAAAGLMLTIGLQYRPEGGAPLGSASVLMTTGLLVGLGALLRLADLSAEEDIGSGALCLVAGAFAAGAAWPASHRRSASCALLSALGAVAFVLFGYQELFDPDGTTGFRWLLLLCAIALVLYSVVLRGSRLRHATVLAGAGGLCTAAIGAILLTDSISLFGLFVEGDIDPAPVSGFWKLVLFAAACGGIAAGVVDRQPGPVLVGTLNAALFIALSGFGDEATLRWWPLLLIAGGIAFVSFGLRPRTPLPPEPDTVPVPPAARTGDEIIIHVRDDT